MMKEGTKVRWGNEIGYVLLPLDIAIRDDDPLVYDMNKKKSSFEATFSYLFTKSILGLFGSKVINICIYIFFYKVLIRLSI